MKYEERKEEVSVILFLLYGLNCFSLDDGVALLFKDLRSTSEE